MTAIDENFWAYPVERVVGEYDRGEISKGEAIDDLSSLGFHFNEIGEILSMTGVLNFAE